MGRVTLSETERATVQVLIRRLLRDWEVWVIIGCAIALSVILSAMVNRQYSLSRIERQLSVIRQSIERIEAKK